MSDGVSLAHHWKDALLLNDGWLLKTKGVDASEEVGIEIELFEGVNGLET